MSFDNITLEKGLYTTGKSFTQALEEIDPSENYKGTSLEGLDAYQRQLKRFDIKVSGPSSDPVSKFFSTSSAAALFPEYISRAVRQGIEKNDKVEKIVATTTLIDSLDYRSIESKISDADLEMPYLGEGDTFSELQITLKDNLTTLEKHGRMLCASYEAIKYQKLDLFTVTLKQIGAHIANSEFKRAIQTIENDMDVVKAAGATFTYDDLLSLWTELSPYRMTSVISNTVDFANILRIPEFRDAAAGLDFHATGNMITPFGAEIINCDYITAGNIIGIDKDYAIEKVQAGGVLVEYDKLIDRQLERAAISTLTGFSRIFKDATKMLKVS